MNVPAPRGTVSADELSRVIASLKHEAKASPERLCAATLLGHGAAGEELTLSPYATRAGSGQLTPVPASPQ